MARFLDPRNDLVFRRIFGQHPELLKSFLNELLRFEGRDRIESLTYIPPELMPSTPTQMRSIVDVRCMDGNGRHFIVEMQMEWTIAFMERLLCNSAKVYSGQLGAGGRYVDLMPVYCLAILNCRFDKKTLAYYHCFEMLNAENLEEKIPGMSIVLIELPKFKLQSPSDKRLAVLWLRFLKEINEQTETVPPEFKDIPELTTALNLCAEAAFTKDERYAYDRYWDAISSERTAIEGGQEIARKEGEAKGRAEGIIEGEAKGRKDEKIEIARKMLQSGIPVQQVAAFTGLTEAEVESESERLRSEG